uniref:Solute carrier family 2, facilitated glucose transporter member 5 n=1 Tax=Hucho hucho TaxID=62062 RepID=A0A4W5KL07_9TELE
FSVYVLSQGHQTYIKAFYNQTMVARNGTGLDDKKLTLFYSVTVSVFAIGGMVGSLMVGMLVTRFGRITCLVFIAGAFMGLSRTFGSPEMIIVGRFITGVHSGNAVTENNTIIRLFGCFLFQRVDTFLQTLLYHFFFKKLILTSCCPYILWPLTSQQEEHWPLFLSLVVIPTMFQLMLLPWFPESPRYLLIEKRNVHFFLSFLVNIQAEIEEMQEEQRSMSSVQTVSVIGLLKDRSVRWQVITIVVVNIGMQLSGIDAIWFYTNAIFENAGIPVPQIQYTTVGTGAIEVIAGCVGCFTIERLGRRPLMIGGFTFMGICCAGITLSLMFQPMCLIVCVCLCPCVAGVPFLITAELFKQSHRPAAYTVAGCLNWLSNFTIGFVFPFLQMSAGAYCYLVFFGVCMAVAVYVFFIVPETKNKTFVEISQMFAARNGMLEEESESSVVDFRFIVQYFISFFFFF